jgi:hypothetical protein
MALRCASFQLVLTANQSSPPKRSRNMRDIVCSVAICLGLGGCAQVYTPRSINSALVQVPVSTSFGAGDQIHLVAIDEVSVDAAENRGEWRIDPGRRHLTIAYEASKKIVGPRVAASHLILNVRLDAGTKYQVVCESSDTGVKAFVRQQSNQRVVSNIAESSLISAPPTYPSPPPVFLIPAARRN